MLSKYIIHETVEKVNSRNKINENEILKSVELCENIICSNFSKITRSGEKLLKIRNKSELLLEFRRYIEMILRLETILCVRNVYDRKISAVSNENLIFYLDRRYYSDFEICSFMDIFKIETNSYKKIFWGESNIQPHLGIILKYVKEHYNTTYRFFSNRNIEYHYIYTVLYTLNDEIKEVIDILNSYHYETSEKNLEMYNTKIKDVKTKIKYILKKMKEIKQNIFGLNIDKKKLV